MAEAPPERLHRAPLAQERGDGPVLVRTGERRGGADTKKGPADAGPFRVPAVRRDQLWVWLCDSAAVAVPEALQA